MKERYEKSELEIIRFEEQDVILTSGDPDDMEFVSGSIGLFK